MKTEAQRKAEEAAAKLRTAVADFIIKADKAAEEFRMACEEAHWDDEPYYCVTEALQKLGVGLAALVQWEAAGEGEDK